MARHIGNPQDIFLNGTGSDIMNNQRCSIYGLVVRYNTNMRNTPAQLPADNIARQIIFGFFAYGNGGPLALQKRLEIRHTAMIDISVRTLQSPVIGISPEIGAHIFMHGLLKIKIKGISKCSNNHVGTHAGIGWHVAARISQFNIFGIIGDLCQCPLARGIYNRFSPGICKSGNRKQ